ncbi:MAG: hypothetical protein H6742_17010 [Alphaproteobacteria bacterium]|nr:hypothetical protein [Alphaproteobacteria bacterium]
MLIALVLACTLPPTRAQVAGELARRRERSQLPAGDCWMRDRLLAGEDPTPCVPGPWFTSYEEEREFWRPLDGWYSKRYTPALSADELLITGINAVHSGTDNSIVAGLLMQTRGLEAGADLELARSLSRWRVTREALDAHHLADSMVHGYGILVVDRQGWRERLGWARIRDAIDRAPPPSAEEWEAMRPPDGTPEAMMWPSLDMLDDALDESDAAWAAMLGD